MRFLQKLKVGRAYADRALSTAPQTSNYFPNARSDDLHDFRRGIVRLPEKPSVLLLVLGLLGAGLVTVGVAGELYIDVKAGKLETEIRKANELRVSLLSKEAGDARTFADEAANASSRAMASADDVKQKTDAVSKQADALALRMRNASRQLGQLEMGITAQGPRPNLLTKAAPKLVAKLAPFAGQRIELFVCGQQGSADQEMLDAWGAIANILDTDGAKWKLVPTNLNFTGSCGAAGLGQGVIVFVTKRASRSTMEAG